MCTSNDVFNIWIENGYNLSNYLEFAGVAANCIEMMGLIGAGNNPMVGMTVAVAVSIEEAATAGKF